MGDFAELIDFLCGSWDGREEGVVAALESVVIDSYRMKKWLGWKQPL